MSKVERGNSSLPVFFFTRINFPSNLVFGTRKRGLLVTVGMRQRYWRKGILQKLDPAHFAFRLALQTRKANFSKSDARVKGLKGGESGIERRIGR